MNIEGASFRPGNISLGQGAVENKMALGRHRLTQASNSEITQPNSSIPKNEGKDIPGQTSQIPEKKKSPQGFQAFIFNGRPAFKKLPGTKVNIIQILTGNSAIKKQANQKINEPTEKEPSIGDIFNMQEDNSDLYQENNSDLFHDTHAKETPSVPLEKDISVKSQANQKTNAPTDEGPSIGDIFNMQEDNSDLFQENNSDLFHDTHAKETPSVPLEKEISVKSQANQKTNEPTEKEPSIGDIFNMQEDNSDLFHDTHAKETPSVPLEKEISVEINDQDNIKFSR